MIKNLKYLLLLSVSLVVSVPSTSFSMTFSSVAQSITSGVGSLFSTVKASIPSMVIVSRESLERMRNSAQLGAENTSVLENAYQIQSKQLEIAKRSRAIRGTLVVVFVGALLAQNAFWHRKKIAQAYRSVISSEKTQRSTN